ncbi:hypothetical protein F4778DRAFT_767912 [Xylariomycetidae sp. FL2044]|nr:hypothetical protein F4778DRAFT_767912 [Xylariomycetidae sp. FL2044]
MPRLSGPRDRRSVPSFGATGSPNKIRSLKAFHDYESGPEGGAYIPDIPRRPTSLGNLAAELVASPVTLKKFRRANMNQSSLEQRTGDRTGPESPRYQADARPEQVVLMPYHDDFEEIETRSPTTGPKSLLTRSTKSRPNSSSSSLAPTSGSGLPPLQTKVADQDGLEPLAEEDLDLASFDLVIPAHGPGSQYSLETRSELLFSTEHLKMIFDDPVLLQRFSNFLYATKLESLPLLLYYMDALKASKAINYANSITQSLSCIKGLDFSGEPVARTVNESLMEKANQAFEVLAREVLPAYITYTWIQTVSVTIKRRIADTLPVHLRDLSQGLAEVFCLTDPSRPDNPIVFASEEFHKTTQYGIGYALGRNCRFLQGPKTNTSSMRRLKEKIDACQEHSETFLNYRRDGTPFMNLLMVAPLYDSRGVARYFIGAQVDVSGLAKECAGLESLERLIEKQQQEQQHQQHQQEKPTSQQETTADARVGGNNTRDSRGDEFQELAGMLSLPELKVVREAGGVVHRTYQGGPADTEAVANWHKPRLVIRNDDDTAFDRRESDPLLQLSRATGGVGGGGRLRGVYEHYLLVRPHPNLRILFASPSMRVPGMLQSSFLSRIGGAPTTRDAIAQAFADGHGVTAKVRWLTKVGGGGTAGTAADSLSADGGGKGRWIHCTPLLGGNGAVGVWMVVLVDDEAEASIRRSRDAPPEGWRRRGGGSVRGPV